MVQKFWWKRKTVEILDLALHTSIITLRGSIKISKVEGIKNSIFSQVELLWWIINEKSFCTKQGRRSTLYGNLELNESNLDKNSQRVRKLLRQAPNVPEVVGLNLNCETSFSFGWKHGWKSVGKKLLPDNVAYTVCSMYHANGRVYIEERLSYKTQLYGLEVKRACQLILMSHKKK